MVAAATAVGRATGLVQVRQRVSDEAWAEMEAKIEALRRWCGPSIIGISQSEAKRLIADAAAAGVAQALQAVAAAEVALERQWVSDEAQAELEVKIEALTASMASLQPNTKPAELKAKIEALVALHGGI